QNVLNMHLANNFQKRSKNALYVEHKTSKINMPKIKILKIQYNRKMMMTNENAKTSLFPRRSRPVAGHLTGRTHPKKATVTIVYAP
ncbi:hypothetical protein WB350_24745, partial [Escherichia coli]|uniref:hypothetical protein n=1 Tax=Escherichia coli TaxID=562 RepID=UPI002147BF3D